MMILKRLGITALQEYPVLLMGCSFFEEYECTAKCLTETRRLPKTYGLAPIRLSLMAGAESLESG